MKNLFSTLLFSAVALTVSAQGWPENYDGVMLQGFSWDDYTNTKWTVMEGQADELSQYFSLIWVPQSGNCGGLSMGYNPLYYFDQNSSFGSEQQLRSMIATFKQKGIGTIADVVINHRQNATNWVDFPAETYHGVTYQMVSTDIVSDDDGGACKEWADANGYKLSDNKDSGEGWDGYRDLDHASENVQTIIKAYEDFLLNDLGYTGFRYDVGKGFAAKYFGLYNEAAKPQFSVGEVWDSNYTIKNWIQGTDTGNGIQSGAFDFQFRYAVRDAMNNSSSMGSLKNDCLVRDDAYRRYAVTFIENHDTQDRTATGGDAQDPIKKYIPAGNAFLLAMPGTPCVFLPHWLEYKADIKQMIEARKAAGITNTTTIEELYSDNTAYIFKSGKLLAMIGGAKTSYASGYTLIKNGSRYYYYLSNECEMPWISLSSAEYEYGTNAQTVKLTAVSASTDAQLVYTTDGSEPTASNGTVVASGSSLTISQTTTLKVGLLKAGVVSNVQTRQYTWKEEVVPEPFDAYDATIYCSTDLPSGWETGYVNFHVWDSQNNQLTTAGWPGDKQTETVTVGGRQWFARTFRITAADYYVNVVFSTKTGSPQTVDVTDITHDAFYEISSSQAGGKNLVTDVTSQYAGLEAISVDAPVDAIIYDLQGRPVREMKAGQLYIRNGRKVMVNE